MGWWRRNSQRLEFSVTTLSGFWRATETDTVEDTWQLVHPQYDHVIHQKPKNIYLTASQYLGCRTMTKGQMFRRHHYIEHYKGLKNDMLFVKTHQKLTSVYVDYV